ncbi:MAG: uracil phosphoribosyltransferase [Bacteroidales bacterium]|nr:uracil phosphoribosyltransferase [Bacteroidales bacterium]MBQ7532750.1 uracil phosphoribosyltransferase [Bacteroidales bacterium]MCR5036825.1 uracil phosphoribosyltransferase [Bacteroidales bacterium]
MVKVIEFGKQNTIINNFVAELRNVEVQGDRMRFRKNLERIGELMAYEISKTFDYETVNVTTPLGEKEMSIIVDQPVLATIMRAGLPLHQGFLNVFDKADNAFIAAYRKYDKNEDFEIRIEYYSAANIDGRVLILVDPMLATGSSLVQCLDGLLHDEEKPSKLHLVAVIASAEGVDYVKKKLSKYDATLWVGDIDDELTAKAYIVPGLGDAGDLAYGEKE